MSILSRSGSNAATATDDEYRDPITVDPPDQVLAALALAGPRHAALTWIGLLQRDEEILTPLAAAGELAEQEAKLTGWADAQLLPTGHDAATSRRIVAAAVQSAYAAGRAVDLRAVAADVAASSIAADVRQAVTDLARELHTAAGKHTDQAEAALGYDGWAVAAELTARIDAEAEIRGRAGRPGLSTETAAIGKALGKYRRHFDSHCAGLAALDTEYLQGTWRLGNQNTRGATDDTGYVTYRRKRGENTGQPIRYAPAFLARHPEYNTDQPDPVDEVRRRLGRTR